MTCWKRLPVRVMLNCLQVRPGSSDPRRARAAALLCGFRQGLYADDDTSATGIEVLEALVDELCAAATSARPPANCSGAGLALSVIARVGRRACVLRGLA